MPRARLFPATRQGRARISPASVLWRRRTPRLRPAETDREGQAMRNMLWMMAILPLLASCKKGEVAALKDDKNYVPVDGARRFEPDAADASYSVVQHGEEC